MSPIFEKLNLKQQREILVVAAPSQSFCSWSISVLGLVFAGLTFLVKGPVGLGAGRDRRP